MISRTIYINGITIQLIFERTSNNDALTQAFEILRESVSKDYRQYAYV